MLNKVISFFKPKCEHDFVSRIKAIPAGDIVEISLEFVLMVILLVCDINFIYNLSNGITFFGDGWHSYEIGLTIFLAVLILILLFCLIKQIFYTDYITKKENTVEKNIQNGRVIEREKHDNKEN